MSTPEFRCKSLFKHYCIYQLPEFRPKYFPWIFSLNAIVVLVRLADATCDIGLMHLSNAICDSIKAMKCDGLPIR